jgi:hypothetical protein
MGPGLLLLVAVLIDSPPSGPTVATAEIFDRSELMGLDLLEFHAGGAQYGPLGISFLPSERRENGATAILLEGSSGRERLLLDAETFGGDSTTIQREGLSVLASWGSGELINGAGTTQPSQLTVIAQYN